MSIMAKTPSGYKKIGSAYLGERPVDKVFNADGDVVYALQRELTGVPPLLFKGKEQSELQNYRIYGDTVDGESVGNRTGNLFDGKIGVDNEIIGETGGTTPNNKYAISEYIPVEPNMSYTYHFYHSIDETRQTYSITEYDRDKNLIRPMTLHNITEKRDYVIIFTTRSDTAYIRINWKKPYDEDLMLNAGSTVLPYEPYGYKVPVTVEGKNLFELSTFINDAVSTVVENITFTINNDGVDISGVASAQYPQIKSRQFELISGETYSAKIFVNGSYNGAIYIMIRGGEMQNGSDASNYKRITVGSGDTFIAKTYNCILYVAQGTNKEFDATVKVMLIKSPSVPVAYEPYHAPVTTPIYLPEPIKMVGDEAEYIDYAEQKLHRVRKNLWSGAVEPGSVTMYGLYAEYSKRIRNKNMPLEPGMYTISSNLLIRNIYAYNDTRGIGLCAQLESGSYSYTFTVPTGANNISFSMMKIVDGVEVDIAPSDFIWGQIEKGSEATTYEPYIENTDLDVTLPALPTIKGTNTLSVDTEVQPSRMDIKGRIKSLT